MLTGRTLGGYAILEEVGRGAMGVVFKARQLSMDRDVAIKFLPKRLALDEKIVARFLREARAAGQLSHPNIVSVHDVGVVNGLHYIAMEFIDGPTVQEKIKKNSFLSEMEALEIAGQIAGALKAAHAQGILHRDIKPDNFLIDHSGRVRLADLGLARVESVRDGGLTQDGTTVGTPHFMSPEQCNGHMDARGDIYSLGASMYTMVTGKTPFDGPTAAAVMVNVLTKPPVPLRKLRPELTPGFVALVDKLMAKEPAMRFADARQAADAIELCKRGLYKAPVAPSVQVTRRFKKQPSALVSWGYGAAAALVAIIALAVLSSHSRRPVTDSTGESAASNPAGNPAKEEPVIGLKTGAEKNDDPKSLANPAPNDPIRQNPAWPHFHRIKNDIAQLAERNPAEALDRLHNFQKAHPQAPPGMQVFINQQIKKAEQAQRDLAREWSSVENSARRDSEAGHNTAFETLANFQRAHEGSTEAREARALRATLAEQWRQKAKAVDTGGAPDKAQQILRDALAKLLPEEGESLARDAKLYEDQVLSRTELADLNGKAAARALLAETVSGRRYRFNESAQLCREGAARLKTSQAQQDAVVLAKVYDKAAEVMEAMRTEVNSGHKMELSNLGNFKSGCVVAWDEHGWSYLPAGVAGLGEQTLLWKAVTPEHLLQMAQGIRKDAQNSSSGRYEIGALAFATGAAGPAAEQLGKAALDPEFKSLAEVPLRLLKLPGKVEEPVKNASAQLEIAQASPSVPEPAPASIPPPMKDKPPVPAKEPDKTKDPEKPKDPDKVKEPEKKDDPATMAAREELKRSGWSEIGGNWQRESPGRFRVKDGSLLCVSRDADVQVAFMLDDNATIGVYVRCDKTGGYGILADNTAASVFGDKLQGSRPLKKPAPAKFQNDIKFLDPRAAHEVRISVREDKLFIYVDGRDPVKSTSDLRDSGDVRIIVSGNALIEAPIVHKHDVPVSGK